MAMKLQLDQSGLPDSEQLCASKALCTATILFDLFKLKGINTVKTVFLISERATFYCIRT